MVSIGLLTKPFTDTQENKIKIDDVIGDPLSKLIRPHVWCDNKSVNGIVIKESVILFPDYNKILIYIYLVYNVITSHELPKVFSELITSGITMACFD